MSVVLAFLELLEGKHRVHVNPSSDTSLLSSPRALAIDWRGSAHRPRGAGPGSWSPACHTPGSPAFPLSAPGLPGLLLCRLWYLIAARDCCQLEGFVGFCVFFF